MRTTLTIDPDNAQRLRQLAHRFRLPFKRVLNNALRLGLRIEAAGQAEPPFVVQAIRKRRLDLNLRQIDVAKTIGCDEMTVVNWEKGHSSPRINRMVKVVEFLGFNPFQKCDTLAQQIVRHRKARGITQKDFARQLEIDPSTLARWERGERTPAGRYAITLKAFLPVSIP